MSLVQAGHIAVRLEPQLKIMDALLRWLSSGASVGAVGTGIAFVFSVFQFLTVKKRESRQQEFEKYHWLIPRVQAGQYILDAGNGEAYFFLELQDPAPVSFLTDSAFTRPGQVDALLNKMAQTRVEYIIWPVELDQPPPGNRGSDALRPLRAYMRKQYRVVKVFTNGDQVWQKHDGADQP